MIKVTCQVEVYNESKAEPSIKIHNHWCFNNRVEIEIDGKRYCVIAEDIITAIKNCINIARY